MGSESLDGGREHLDWDRFGVASRDLAQEIADSGFRPDSILAIARGGMFVAGALGYALSEIGRASCRERVSYTV